MLHRRDRADGGVGWARQGDWGYGAGGWRFVAAVAGMRALDKVSGQTAAYDGAAWVVGTVNGATLELAGAQVVGARLAAVANPFGGASVDVEARAAIIAILDRMRSHGLIAS